MKQIQSMYLIHGPTWDSVASINKNTLIDPVLYNKHRRNNIHNSTQMDKY